MAKHCVEELSSKEFENFISKDFVVIDFFAEWCMPCLMMSPVFEELCEKLDKKISFGKINIDDSSDIAEKYNVMSIPTFIVFKKGKETERFTGTINSEQFEEKLRGLI